VGNRRRPVIDPPRPPQKTTSLVEEGSSKEAQRGALRKYSASTAEANLLQKKRRGKGKGAFLIWKRAGDCRSTDLFSRKKKGRPFTHRPRAYASRKVHEEKISFTVRSRQCEGKKISFFTIVLERRGRLGNKSGYGEESLSRGGGGGGKGKGRESSPSVTQRSSDGLQGGSLSHGRGHREGILLRYPASPPDSPVLFAAETRGGKSTPVFCVVPL